MRKKVFCACSGAVPVLLWDVLSSFDTEEDSVFVSEEDVQAFYTRLQVHVEKIAAAGSSLHKKLVISSDSAFISSFHLLSKSPKA